MPFKQHSRQYDLIVFGATGYTGKLTAQHITTHLPTDLKWAVAGRSRDKLQRAVEDLKFLNPDRLQPSVEVCNLSDDDLTALAKKTLILITTVGPYHRYGEHAFKACAEQGTHYLDVTGEAVWVAKMIRKYESVARSSGAKMFPQIGIESAPPDLVTFALASVVRSQLSGAKVGPVTVSIHKFKSAPSGGTVATVLSIRESFSLPELQATFKPYALSPVPNPNRSATPKRSFLTKLTGLINLPILGLHTTALPSSTDRAIVQRSWGLYASGVVPGQPSYGPNFSFSEFMRTRSWTSGIMFHFTLIGFGLLFVIPQSLRNIVAKWLVKHGPGEGPDQELAKTTSELEYRGTAVPDVEGETKRGFCRAWYKGDAYYCEFTYPLSTPVGAYVQTNNRITVTGVLLAEAASSLLEDDDVASQLPGGVFTAACLGQPFIDRLDNAGFHFESKLVDKNDRL
ncbi:Saccharopine dehydrogenase-domain-containing protein [Apodospora peruviana]|uniref:Saccharopine dehydrogenase-domain-containing protein n=1 Tax=Apodospora peruviana TaxID=516989 RepID=A0AAE0HV68_9PEZI|nr:Saccharopine dehydrogenase-domain-containing protein [Apodospora peruviana]